MNHPPNFGRYPETVIIKDSRLTWTLITGFLMVLLFYLTVQTNYNFAQMVHPGGYWILGFLGMSVAFTLMPKTVTTLRPEGVEVTAAFSKSVVHNWDEISDFRVYKQGGYLGVGRQFVTFQDPSKTFQKHVFLAPINIWSNPKDVLETVKIYQRDALEDS